MRAGELVETQDVRSYFKENLVELVDQHGMEVGDDVVAYVTNLLTAFVRAEHFYEWSPQGPTLTPLAMLYAEVVNTPSTKYKQQLLQRMGDVALFVAGVFAESFHRKSYDVDYYIDMGAAAYGSLSDSMDAQSRMFAELSACFCGFCAGSRRNLRPVQSAGRSGHCEAVPVVAAYRQPARRKNARARRYQRDQPVKSNPALTHAS